MHLKELVSVRICVNLLKPQFIDQCDVALSEVIRPRQLRDLLDRLNPAFQGALISNAGLFLLGCCCLTVHALDGQVDSLLVEEAVQVHALWFFATLLLLLQGGRTTLVL